MILITGATGRSGSAIVREFARRGTPVRALARDAQKAAPLAALPGVDVVYGDMLRATTLGRALEGVTRALMISGARERLVETQAAFVDAAKAAGVPHIVKFSGRESGMGFDPTVFRGTRAHEEAERYLERSGLTWTHLRPSQFMQVYVPEHARTVAADGAIYLPIGDATLAPIDIEDIARIAYAVLHAEGQGGQRHDMTGPEALTMHDVAARLSAAIGRPVRYVPISDADYRRRLEAARVPDDLREVLCEVYAARRHYSVSHVVLDAHVRFGVAPTPFAAFASRHAKAFRGEAA
jgi:uncharacterized protein YbjT (DUF2867 family)